MAPSAYLMLLTVAFACRHQGAAGQATSAASDGALDKSYDPHPSLVQSSAGLLALKSAAPANAAPLASWTGDSPCGARPWDFVTCDQGRVVALDLGNRALAGSLPAELSSMASLQLLTLGGNTFAGSLPGEWGAAGAFPSLVSLDASGNKLQGELPPTWCNAAGSLAVLQTLQLNGNGLSGTLPDFWGGTGCQQMRRLDLQDNSFTGGLPAFWASTPYWPNLASLHLDGNDLSGEFPAEWTAPTAFPAMRADGTGIVLQPGNQQLVGGVPGIAKFPVLAATPSGGTATITTLKDTSPAPAPEPAAVPEPAPQPAPSINATAEGPSTITAVIRLSGSGLWPFAALQQTALSGVILVGLTSGADAVDAPQPRVTIGTATRVSDGVSEFASVKTPSRRMLQSAGATQVPVYVLTTVGEAAAVQSALTTFLKSSSFRTQLRAAGLDVSSVALRSIDSAAGDRVPEPTAAAAAPVPAPSGGGGGASIGAVVGGVLGGLAGLILIGLALWACYKQWRQSRQAQYITQRIVKPVRQSSFSGASMPYRKSSLATVQESYAGEWAPAMDAVSTHSDSPSQRSGGRLTAGLYRSSGGGGASQELNLLDHARGPLSSSTAEHPAGSLQQAPQSPPHSPTAAAAAAGLGSGQGAAGGDMPLTQRTLSAHTQYTNPPRAATASWTARFSQTFAASR